MHYNSQFLQPCSFCFLSLNTVISLSLLHTAGIEVWLQPRVAYFIVIAYRGTKRLQQPFKIQQSRVLLFILAALHLPSLSHSTNKTHYSTVLGPNPACQSYTCPSPIFIFSSHTKGLGICWYCTLKSNDFSNLYHKADFISIVAALWHSKEESLIFSIFLHPKS